ncbi:integrase arm-type DNA-binding domain-containing protein [Novosphingobium sp. KA1]|uniref:tyrosine-type recombinase/integrase n=1 Tax=Novosphingobium sp. (strain KA1) TaxID=164608 RepID=UPI001A8CCC63|nr:integrase arm-type DNA-binding domain-containing protein [Novosphingobium sp. KA1]QSR16089.1 integrase [Novosphingobium sp. KA1]
MLTNGVVKAAAARPRAYKMADTGSLFLFVTPKGTKSWRLKYRFQGREKLLVIGRFPEISLAQARQRRDEAKVKIRLGVDPSVAEEKLDTFEQVARAWYRHNENNWSPAHGADVIASLLRDIFPAIGARPIASIEPPEILEVLRQVEERGRIETARRQRQRLSAIFGYGIANGLTDKDPALHVGRAMTAARPVRPQPALTTATECRDLLNAADRQAGRASTRLASRFLALTAVRLEAVRGMRWSEVEQLDGAEPLWRVPAARMKLKRSKKGDDRFAHAVPLSRAAIAVLRLAAHEFGYDALSSCPDELVFPGRDRGKPIGESAIGALYDRAGFSGRHVPHGWRSSFSTILNETLGPDAASDIDRALAHTPKDKVEAAYNRAQLLGRRRALFDTWGDLLTA